MSSCRLRKVECECGYVARVTRGWLEQGLPSCPAGHDMRPVETADLAWIGLVGPEDMPSAMWTVVCRENGWDAAIQRKGAAAKSYNARVAGRSLRARTNAAVCAYPGCGRFVRNGVERCGEHSPPVEVMPF